VRSVLAGNGSDSTAAVQAMLLRGNEFHLPNLFLIGEPEDPMARWLCDWPAPLCWPIFTALKTATPVAGSIYTNAFDPAVIARGKVTSKFGLDVDALDITWNPRLQVFGTSVANASPLQLAQAGYYDNKIVRVWTAYLPTRQDSAFVFPGDCNTYGASQLFGGRIADTQVGRNSIKWTVNSLLDVVKQQVPLNVIEATNVAAAFSGKTPPNGLSAVPTLTIGSSTPSTQQTLIAQWSGGVFPDESLAGGGLGPPQTCFVQFVTGANAGFFSAVFANNTIVVSATNWNLINLMNPMPFPVSSGDTFIVSGSFPISQNASLWDSGTTYNQGDQVKYIGAVYVSLQGSNTGNTPASNTAYWQAQPYYGFEYVPSPQSIG
jgi:hypothetical protein